MDHSNGAAHEIDGDQGTSSAHKPYKFFGETAIMSTFDTVWPADSVEFCPHPAATDIFVCGTYLLEKSEAPVVEEDCPPSERPRQKRRGKCLLFAANEEDNDTL